MDADRYEGLGYRRMISWSSRLRREWPLFEFVFGAVPVRSLLDLGCGPGEHCARFAAEGWQVTGVDRSAAQIEAAREHHPELHFVQADLGNFSDAVEGSFGAALCIGNVLPNLEDSTLDALLGQLRERVVPAGRLLLQQLEFGPIVAGRRRSIGPIFSSADDDEPESAFLRIFCPTEDPGWVDFLPTRFRLNPAGDEPVSVERTSRIRWRARTRPELESALEQHGFGVRGVWGGPERQAHDPATSDDLWILGERTGA